MTSDALTTLLRAGPLAWDAVGCDAPSLLHAARAEDVCALLYYCQHGAPQFASWPATVRQALEHESRAAVARELLVQRELTRVLDALNQRGTHPLLVKGTALAYTRYPHPSLRSRSDTDLLIRESQRDAVRAALESLGYSRSLLCEGEILFRQFEMARDDDYGVPHALDVHWAVSAQAAFAGVLTYEEMWSRALPAPALGGHARVPATVDSLLLALIHPAMHHRNQHRLLWDHDVCLLVKAMDAAGCQELVRHAIDRRVAAVCADGLRSARDRLGARVPPSVLDQLGAAPLGNQLTAEYLGAHRSWARETAASLRALDRWRDRLRLFREIALPSPGHMLRAYGVGDTGLGRTLLPALYLHRGVRGVLRVVSGRK